LKKAQKDSIRIAMNKIGKNDQKYRWQLMLGELDSLNLDSLKKLPEDVMLDRMKKVMNSEIGFSKAIDDSIWKLQAKLDSLNKIKFLAIIDKYGYPSEKRIGSYVSSTLVLHFVGEKEFASLLPVFQRELEKKNMSAHEYASWYDRCRLVIGKKQLYGEYGQNYRCVENLAITNIERKKIGLKPLKNNFCQENSLSK
jgi:hypothetical protein